jgi:5-methylcytosine-specific restriction protein A
MKSELTTVRDFSGSLVKAEFLVEAEDGELSVVFESRGGSIGASNERNSEYNRGVDLVLERLAHLGCTLVDAVVDTAQTRKLGLSRSDRRLLAMPSKLKLVDRDPVQLRTELCAAQRPIGRSKDAKGSGNNTKRMRLYIEGLTGSVHEIARELAGGASPARSDDGQVNRGQKPAVGRNPTNARATYLFAWNPAKWPWDSLHRALHEIAATGATSEWWSCQSHKSIRPGDRAFLVRLGVAPRGIMASGFVQTESFLAPHWSGEDKLVNRVDIEFDTLIDPSSGNLLSLESFDSPPFSLQTWTPQASGISIAPEAAEALEAIWFQHVEELGLPGASPNYVEGAKKHVSSTRYERNPHARKACIEHYGAKCVVCDFEFGRVYGDLGAGFIHVHHLDPVSQAREARPVDPVKDLRPVCPNCHAMLHRESPPIDVKELRRRLE